LKPLEVRTLALDYVSEIIGSWEKVDQKELNAVVEHTYSRLIQGELVLVAGNGGSSSTASHFVNDWTKGLRIKANLPVRALSLSDNVSTLTALANDYSYKEIFSFQLENYVGIATTLICISGSGNSKNILAAAKRARELNMTVIGLIGFDGGELKSLCDLVFHCKVNDMQIVEDMHLSFGHMVLRRHAN
jgi:D-sedoheptulose 7-phosphate isomerase